MMRNSYWLPELFNDLMNAGTAVSRQAHTAPATNVWEDNSGYTVEMAAPGLKKEDCTVKIDDEGNLQVNMEQKHDEKATENCKYLGFWKVYGDVEKAKKTFAGYESCTKSYNRMWRKGVSLRSLIVS